MTFKTQEFLPFPLKKVKTKPKFSESTKMFLEKKKPFGKCKKTFSPQILIGFVHKNAAIRKGPFLPTTTTEKKKAEISTSFISKWWSKASGPGSKRSTPSQHH